MPSSRLSRRTSSHTAARLTGSRPGGRLVEEQDLGVVHQGGRQVEPPPHAPGVGADRPVEGVAEVDELAQLGHAAASRAWQAVEPALQPQQLGAGLLGVERRLLQGGADAQPHLAGSAGDVVAGHRGPAPGGASSVQSMRTVVDLPAPFGPRNP